MSKSKFSPEEKQPVVLADPLQSDNSNETSPPEHSSLIDMECFSEITSGDEKIQRELIELYLHQTTEDLVKLKEALAAGGREKVKQLAHSMVGGSATCGMTAITTSLRELERMADAGELDKTTSVLAQIEKEFKHTSLFLQGLISARKA
jgi:HPt (histidine-containing phosphotransfer) domain-containing protein